METNEPMRLIRRREVESRTGLSRSGIYGLMASKQFPRPVKLGNGIAVAWVESEVAQWIESRIRERA